MEVHYHPDLHHKPKPWKEYLLEFLMIFLAVTMGFFAESFREHISERRMANDLAFSMIKDLQKDTILLNRLRSFRTTRSGELDSCYALLNIPPDKIDSRKYYRLVREFMLTYWSFRPSNGTVNELKNAGYFRYFLNDDLPGLLTDYEYQYQDSQLLETMELNEYTTLQSEFTRVSDRHLLNANLKFRAASRGTIVLAPIPGSGITPIPEQDLNVIQNNLTKLYDDNYIFYYQYDNIKKSAVKIMDYLHKKYNR